MRPPLDRYGNSGTVPSTELPHPSFNSIAQKTSGQQCISICSRDAKEQLSTTPRSSATFRRDVIFQIGFSSIEVLGNSRTVLHPRHGSIATRIEHHAVPQWEKTDPHSQLVRLIGVANYDMSATELDMKKNRVFMRNT